MSIITLTTDFGTGSPYVAAMKGVILSINSGGHARRPDARVPPQDVRQAALVLDDVDRAGSRDDTIHVVVVDPGRGHGSGDPLRPHRPAAVRRPGQRRC